MIKLLGILLVFALAAALGLFIEHHPGEATLHINNTTMAMPIWFVVLALLFSFVVFYVFFRSLGYLMSLPRRFRRYRQRRAQCLLQQKNKEGLQALIEGDFSRAERAFLSAAKKDTDPVFNYLQCARAAQEQGSLERRDHYLALAQKTKTKKKALMIALATAELHLQHGETQIAILELQALQKKYPKQTHILKLLTKAYGTSGDWAGLATLLPALNKRKVLPQQHRQALQLQIHEELLNSAHDPASLDHAWGLIPSALQKDPNVLACYCQHLLQQGKHREAEQLLRQTLKKNPDPRLIVLYSHVLADPSQQLVHAERWLKQQGESAALTLCLGRLCKRNRLWGKARYYLEQSLKLEPQACTYQELGEVLEELGDSSGALATYKQGVVG